MAVGIEVRHERACRARSGGRCNCRPTYRASVWSARESKLIRKSWPTLAAAKLWRHDAAVAVQAGTLKAPTATTLGEAAAVWLEGARDGSIRNRSGDRYKPSAIRTYDQSLRLRVLPTLGSRRLADIRRVDLQDFADRLLAARAHPATIQAALMPVRAIYARAVSRGEVAVNPTTGLRLPAVRSRRDRIAAPDEATKLVAALPQGDRPLWATALYAGLRRGELMALRWEDVDLATGTIRVERSWDAKEGVVIQPKSRGGRRRVPIPAALRDHLVEHRMQVGRSGGLVFGMSATRPFAPSTVTERAGGAWKAAKLNRITLHECRHTFASLMIAAGVNAKALSVYMGHASVAFTLDRYGHLMPGNEEEAADLLDAFLERANTQARLAQLDRVGAGS
jgi:integrase